MNIVVAVLVGVVYVLLNSLIPEPARRRFNAIMVGGAGAAYLSGGGLGPWEFAFTAVLVYVAYRGLESWTFTGIGWLLHTAWDVVHHLRGEPIIPFAHDSSLGCAVCDPVIAIWCLAGGPARVPGPGRRRAQAEITPRLPAGCSSRPADPPRSGGRTRPPAT